MSLRAQGLRGRSRSSEMAERAVRATLTNRGLLRAVMLAFALFLVYRFMATVTAMLLLLAAALLVAVILSVPVEALHQRSRLSRPVVTGFLVSDVLAVLAADGLLLFPVLANQASQVASELPGALSRLVERTRELAQGYGFQPGNSSYPYLSSVARRRMESAGSSDKGATS